MSNAQMIQRRQLIRTVMVLSIIFIGGIGAWLIQPNQKASAASYTTTTLLLVHGFDDTCQGAFETGDGNSHDSTTVQYLRNNDWGNAWDPIVEVGYYTGENCLTYGLPSGFSINIQDNDATDCTVIPSTSYGTTNDSIRHLACLFAWYVQVNFTQHGIPVEIVAHSMGGLIVRDALGESGYGTCDLSTCNGGFPTNKLDIRAVMTVATPHGGVYGEYYSLAKIVFGDPQELEDMNPNSTTSNFMQLISGIQDPQGASGTHWYLMAGSVHCVPASLSTGTITCAVEHTYQNGAYPDGDGVVQADSALSMKADIKILYGVGFCAACNQGNGVIYSADPNTQYSHEANSCLTAPLPVYDPATGTWTVQTVTICPLSAPYYLNDATSGQTTRAWICQSSCNAPTNGMNGITDVQVINSSGSPTTGQPAPHSLAEILSLLPAPPPPPTPTPTNTPVTACSVTNETDSIEPGSTYTDNRGNIWHVYYDIKRDATTNKPCQMRVLVRIFNPAPDGMWSGSAAVYAVVNGTNNNASYGKVSGSCTYQNHFVWRGPWFGVSSNRTSYHIEDVEFNGSNAYPRASADFWV